MAGEEFKVRVGVELDDASFNSLKNQINSVAQKEPIKVKVDTKDAENRVKSLKTQIESLGKTNISLNGATKIESTLSDIASSVKEMKASLSSINNVKIKPQMDVGDIKKAATEAKQDIENVASIATKTKKKVSGVFTSAIRVTGENLTGINKQLKDKMNGLGISERAQRSVTRHLKDMKVALDDITVGSGKNTIEITTHGFDEAGRKITKLMKAKEILDDEGNFTKWDWNVDTTKVTKQIDTLGEAIKKSKSIIKDFNGNTIQTNVKVIEDSFKKLGESSNQSLKEMQTSFNNFTAEYSQWQASSTKNNPTEVRAMVDAYNELTTAMTKAKNEERLLRSNAGLSKATDDVGKEFADLDLTFKKAGASVSSLDTKFSKISGQSKEAEAAVEKLKSVYDELGASIKKNTTQVVEGDDTTREVHNLNEIILALENYKKAYEEAAAAVKKNKAESDKVLSAEKYKNDKTNFINQIERYKSDNSAALLKYGKQLDELIAKTKQLNGVSLNGVKQEFKELQNTIEKDGLATQSFGDKLKTQFKRYAAYFSIASVTMEATQALRQMYQSVLEIDTAMTELYRVTDLTSQGYANLYDNMIASAKQYGATLSDIINSTADWSRAGFDPETANSLAGITMMYEHIADIDYDEATQNLLTAYKGFQGQLDSMFNNDAEASVTYIADILNELDNNYAVTAAGVGEAMRRSAASMDVANNSIEQTAALITGAIEVTQDPEGAGNALKVVSMRLRGAKGELEDLGEEVDSNVENLTQMQGKILNLTHGKVNIFEDNGDFKSTYDILVGIADVYDQLSDMEQADLLETIAGKHRANTVASIIGNIDQVKAAYQSATEASGSASEENEKYMNSLEGHLNKLTTAWQSFSNSFLSSGFLKGLISTASGFLNVIDSIVDKMGTIPTIISLIAAGLSGIKNIGFFKTVKDEATGFVTKMELSFAGLKGKIGEFKDLLNNSVKFDFDKDFTDSLGLNEKTLNQYIAGGQKSEYLEDATDAVVDYVKATDKASISVEDFRGKQMAAAAQVNGSANTFKSVSNVISVFNSMLKETEKTQQGFINAIANSNPKLASYLSSVKAGSASFKRYIGSLIGATAKTAALTAVTTALNAALTMGISVLVSAAISAIDNWIHKNEKLADSVQDVIDKYNEQKNSLKDAKAVVDEVVTSDGSKSRYEELSKGVDSLGKNVSLTADEYSEYLDITSRIASTFPELIQGYDSQGNAILSCKGNVEELTEAYNKLGHAANKEILNKDSIDDIQEDFKNDIEDLNDSGWLDDKLTTDASKALEKMINSDDVGASVEKNAEGYYTQIAKALHDAKIGDYESIDPYWSTTSQLNEYITKCIETDRGAVQKIVNAHNSELDDAASEMKTAAEAMLSEAFDFSDSDYHEMSDSLKTIAQQAVSNLDGEFYKKVVDSGGNVKDYIQSMVEALDELDNRGNSTVETAFDLQTKFNNGEVSYGEYADALAKAQNTIDHLEGVDGEIKAQLKLALDTKDAENQYETFVNRLTEAGWSEDAAKKFARSLSSSEMEVAFDLIAKGELKVENADELREQLEEQAKLNEAMSFSIDMEAETEGIEALTTALTESNSATGLTVESMEKLKARYKDLDGYNPATLFQETANGLMLNASAARELEKAYAESKLSEANDNLTTLKQRYDELGVEIRECDDASKKASLINEREDIRQQITQVAEYATALEGLTSAYTDWQTAESAGSNRDMYSSIQSAMESVKEELDLGWIDDGTKEYFDLIWGDNWNGAGKGISDYRAQWDTLDDTIEGTTYSLQDFFKTDEDGNLTSKGIYNFLDAVKQKQKELGKDWVQTDKNGNIVSFDFGIDGTKAVADALGISEDLVNIFLKASQDCGFVVNFDGTYKQLADLQNEAMAANDKLKELGKTKYTFNFDSTSVKDLKAQLKVAQDIVADKKFWNKDGTFNFNVEGATEAMTIVSTLQAKIDNLNHKYIGFTVEDDELEKPLSILQDYEAQVDNLNQLKLNPVFNADSIEAGEENLNDLAQQMIDLPDSIKSRLKIDGIDDVDDMRKKIESGEIKIPTTLDIQTSINDNLEDLVDIGLYSSGMLDETRAKEIEQKFNVKAVVSDDSDTAEDLEKSVHERFADYSGTEDLDVDVNVNVEGEQDVGSLIDYLGDLSDEQIQVIANVVGKVDVEQLQSAINDIDDDKYIKLIAEALGSGDVNALADAINKIPDENVKKAIAKAFGYNSVEELDSAIRGMDNKTVKAIAQALGISDVNSLKNVVNSLDNKTVKAIAEAIGQGKVQSLIDTIAGLHNKKVTITTVMTTVKNVVTNAIKNGAAAGKAARNNRFGSSNVDGTAFAEGTVNNVSRRGNWGTKNSGKALVGELGQELLVRDGQYYTIGDNGAEFIDYKKGDIIFNAGQTRQLFEQGKIANGQTRGRAYANGTAFAPGTVGGTMSDFINAAAILYGKDGVIDDDQLSVDVGVNLDTSSIEAQLVNYGKGGNVNLLVRPQIDTQYLKDVGWDDAGDGVATVFTSTYSNEDGTVAVNFTPIIVDENGNFVDVLGPDELQEYAEGVIAGTQTDYRNLQIGAEFTGEDAIEKADRAAQRIHELHEIYFADDPVIQYASEDSKKSAKDTASGYTESDYPVYDVKFTYSSESNWLDDLNGYIEESASSTGLLVESMAAITDRYKDLEGYDPNTLFQQSATGIQLNTDAVKKYEKQIAKANLDKVNKTIKAQKREYYANAKAIKTCTDATEKNKLINRNNNLSNMIAENEKLAASYEGLTSKYNQWITASSETKQREPYDNINSEYDTVMDLLDRGWVGDEEVTSFLDLIFGDNYSTVGKRADQVADDLRNALQQNIEGTSFSIGDFFTYDDNGNTTADGYFNMLDAIMQKQEELGKNWVQKNENGEYTFDFGVTGLDEIAEAFGVSKDLIALILQAGRDAGHTVNFDGVIGDIDNLQEKATNAVNTLHEMGTTDYQFNLDTNDTDSLNEQLTVAQGLVDQFRNEDGTINIDAPGAQEAVDLLTYIQAQIDLINSHYIGIKTDDTSLQEPLEKLQDYEIYAAQLNSLKINPQVNADEITNVEQKMQEIVDYIAGLDSETLGKLGLNFDGLSPEEIQNQIREAIGNGSITIPVSVEPEVDSNGSVEDEIGEDKIATVTLNTVVNATDVETGEKWKEIYDSFPEGQENERNAFVKGTITLLGNTDDLKNYIDVYDRAPDENKESLAIGTATLNGKPEELDAFITTYDKMPDDNKDSYLSGTVTLNDDPDGLTAYIKGYNDAPKGLKNSYLEGSMIFDNDKDGLDKYVEGFNKTPNDNKESYIKGVMQFKNDKDAADTFVEAYNSAPDDGKDIFLKGEMRFDGDLEAADEYNSIYKSLPEDDKTVLSNYVIKFGENGEENALKVLDFYRNVPEGERDACLNATAEITNPDVAANVLEMFAHKDGYTRRVIIDVVATGDIDRLSSLTGTGLVSDEESETITEAASDTQSAEHRGTNYVNSLNEMDYDHTQTYIDTSGVKEAATDAEHLREVLGSLSTEELSTLLTMLGAGTDDIDSMTANVENLKNSLDELSDEDILNLFTNLFPGVELSGLEAITANVENFMTFWNSLDNEQQIQLAMKLFGVDEATQQVEQVNQEIDSVDGKTATATVSVDSGSVDTQSGETTVVMTADDSDVTKKASEQRTSPVRFAPDITPITQALAPGFPTTAWITPKLTNSSVTVTVNTNTVSSGKTSKANGTAYVNGTVGKAFKHGNWGTKESGTALVGELGQEMVVRDGQFFTVGDSGAEFFDYKKGDIVFNAGQTKQLFEQGKIVNGQTRGRAYANGTAFVNGGGVGRPHKTTTSGSRGNYTGSGGGSGSSSGSNYDSGGDSDASDEADEFEETLDWIETKIDRIERAISKLDTTASSVYKNWGTRNEALVNQIGKVGEEINLQQQAYDRYMKQANSVGLSEDYASKVRDGTIDIETITDEDLNDKISDYKEW